MSSFDIAIPVILKHEGGWVSDPDDRGGETNFGISTLIVKRLQADEKLTDKQVADLLGIAEAEVYKPNYMKTMKVDAAKHIYRRYFWDQPGYGQITDQNLATKTMDIAVNCGEGNAEKMLQEAANDCGAKLTVDGKAGPKTFAAVNAADPKKLIEALRNRQITYYNLVALRGNNKKFLPGWLKRAAWVDSTGW